MEHELQVQVALGVPLVAIKGYTALEVEQVYTRALELSRAIGDTRYQFAALQGLRLMNSVRGELRVSRGIGEQLVALAEETQSRSLRMIAHSDLGYVLLWLGKLRQGRAHLDQAIGLYNLEEHASLRFVYGLDRGIANYVQLSYTLWLLGYPTKAQQAIQNALTLAQELSDPHSVVIAFGYAAGLQFHFRNYPLAYEHAEATFTLAAEHGLAWWTAMSLVFRGRALAAQGQPTEGISQIQQGLDACRALGAVVVWQPFYLALLADAYGQAGQAAEGLHAVADAFEVVNTTHERWYDAELCRLKGELTLQLGTMGSGLEVGSSSPQAPSLKPQVSGGVVREAEECFRKAIAIAQKQHAKSWELRAATSLARLWQQQGKTTEARDLLAPVYNWFTEGFDTRDLQEAKALLNELT